MKNWHIVALSVGAAAAAAVIVHRRGKRAIAARDPSRSYETPLVDVMTAGVRTLSPWGDDVAPTDVTAAVAPLDRLDVAAARSKPGMRLAEPGYEEMLRSGVGSV